MTNSLKDKALTAEPGQRELPGLLLLFEPGRRPDRDAMLSALSGMPRVVVSCDPASVAVGRVPGRRALADPCPGSLEVLADGLAFDLRGLLPGTPIVSPDVEHWFECEPGDLNDCEAVGLFPGPHLAEGANALPVVRTLLGLGAKLAELFSGVRSFCWTPARTAVSSAAFARAVNVWLDGGQFPAPGLFALHQDADGSMRSDGFAFFIDWEFVIDRELCGDHAAATRLAASAAHDLVGYGAPEEPREMLFGQGCIFKLELDRIAGMVKVRPSQECSQICDGLAVG